MFSRLEVQHFKSLEHAIVDLGMINIFVGQNGSGKSNIVDAVRFLKDAASISLDRAVSDRHGIESVRQWSPTRPYRIHLSIAFEETGTYGSYSVNIDSAKGQLKVFSEEVTSKSKELYDLAEIEDDDSDEDTEGVTGKGRFYSAFMRGRVARDKEGNVTSTVERHAFRGEEFRTESIDAHFDEFRGKPEVLKFRGDQFDELVFNFRPMWPLYEVRRILNNFQAYSIYPNTLRIPQDPSNETYLSSEGRNLASVFKRMRKTRRGSEAIAQITDAMKGILPTLERITILNVGGYLVPQFHMIEATGKRHTFNVSQMSDGTLRVLGILTALYQEPRPAVIALEEPEQTVNPGVLTIIADSIKEVSKTTQVLVTTHSPNLLDHFQPDQMKAVELSSGKTRVGPISPMQVDAVQERLFTIGELLVTEGIHS